jgi:hypothetical protein
MKYFSLLLFLLLSIAGQYSHAQYYDTGQDPAGIKWMQIKTGKFNVIYPEKYGTEGINFARALERSQTGVNTLFPGNKSVIPVLIHSYSTQSNGYVAWAPKRMELYPMPDQNSVPGDANTLLTMHELTHVLQMQSLNRGFTRASGYLLGEQVTGIASALLPGWFLEGDAVFAETILSSSGRGRSPAFQKQVKAMLLEGKKPGYDKIINGSFRDFVPDKYQTGFQMVTWSALTREKSLWNKVLNFTGEQPFTINPVNISLKKNAGLTKKRLYDETFDTLRSIWSRDNDKNARDYRHLNQTARREYINYYSPVYAGSDSIIAIKTSFSRIPRIVLLNPSTGKEKFIHNPGYMYPMLLSCAAGKIVWVETRPDARWDNRDYSVIMLYDIRSRLTIKISGKSRYAAASIAPDGKLICAVENTTSNQNNLVLIDPETKEIIKTIPSPGNAYLQRPQWSNDGKKITVIYLTAEGEGITSLSVDQTRWDVLKPAIMEDLQSAFIRNDSLFYVSSGSGTENLCLETSTGVKQLTHSRYGANDPSMRAGTIIFSDYTSHGNALSLTSLKEASPVSVKNHNEFLVDRAVPERDFTLDTVNTKFQPLPYRKWQHLFRFHSWMPFYADLQKIQADPLAVRPGLTIMSQNTLSSLITTIGYEYTEDKRHVFHSKASWKGWFPVFEIWYDYGQSPLIQNPDMTKKPLNRPGMDLSGSVSFPVRMSAGQFNQYVRPSFSVEVNRNIYQERNGTFDYQQSKFNGRLYLSNFSRYAARDIYPRWAQSIDLNYVFSPFDTKIFGSSAFIRTAFYFPGLFSNNGIKIRYEREKQDQSFYVFGNRILFPRGIDNHVISKDLQFASIDYVFPVAYPDLSVASLFYLKRIRSGLFYDYASGKRNLHYTASRILVPGRESFRSFGFELLGDFHLFRIPFLISGGVRSAWKDTATAPTISALFNMDIYGFSIGNRRHKEL